MKCNFLGKKAENTVYANVAELPLNLSLIEYQVPGPCNHHTSTQSGNSAHMQGQFTILANPTTGAHLPEEGRQKNLLNIQKVDFG